MVSNTIDCLVTLHGCIVGKVVPFATDGLPAILQQAFLSVAEYAGFLVAVQAGVSCSANVDAIITKVIIVSVNFLHTVQSFASHVIGITAVLVDPAFLQGINQGISILEGCVGILEVRACISRVIGIMIRIEAEGCLIFGFGREGNQAAGAHVDTIADIAFMDRLNLCRIIPYAVLRRQLDAIDDAQRVGRGRINGMRLLDPVQLQLYRIGFFIHVNAGEIEVFIDQRQFTDINIKALVELDLRLNPGHIADTLSQLQQERPGRRAFHICTRQHINQLIQTLRDRNRRHIQRDGVGCDHVLIRINDIVDVAIFHGGVAHIAVPCQHTAAAGRLIKVEAVFALLIQRHVNAVLSRCILRQRSRDFHRTE